jgi:hypothetical protein
VISINPATYWHALRPLRPARPRKPRVARQSRWPRLKRFSTTRPAAYLRQRYRLDKLSIAVNLKAAKTLGLLVPPELRNRSDEVIE